jgi:hypothetical protein
VAEQDDELVLQLDAIERHLEGLEANVHLLVALRLVEDGHAPDLNVGLVWAKDLDRLRRLYPEADHG